MDENGTTNAKPPAPLGDDREQPTSEAASPKEVKSYSPNIPHPSLDFPPLYFLLSLFPGVRAGIRRFYSWRWSLSYPLQKRVTGSKLLQKMKIFLTYGEILIFIPLLVLAIICTYQAFMQPTVSGTGKAARLAVAAALLFGQKNSYITMVLGIPFDRAVTYHKISGYVAVITGLMHTASYFLVQEDDLSEGDLLSAPNSATTSNTGGGRGQGGRGNGSRGGGPSHRGQQGAFLQEITDESSPVERLSELFEGSMNTSGTFILLCIILMLLTSIPVIRRKMFEVFYFVHMTLLVGIIVVTAFHTGWMVPLFVFLTTGVDMIIRKIYMARFRYPREASLKIVSESVVEVTFPKIEGFDYNPGQYVYIAIPELSSWEWHPFSLSTAPHQSKVTLHIRVAGNWTSALHELAFKKKTVAILMEGPYGNFGVDVMNDKRYKVALLLSGGIGLTPMQSMFSHLIHEQSTGIRDLKKLKFVWIQRDPELMHQSRVVDTSVTLHASRHFEPEYHHDDDESFGGYSLASGLLSRIPAGRETDAELDQMYQSMDFHPEAAHPHALEQSGKTTMIDDDDSSDDFDERENQMSEIASNTNSTLKSAWVKTDYGLSDLESTNHSIVVKNEEAANGEQLKTPSMNADSVSDYYISDMESTLHSTDQPRMPYRPNCKNKATSGCSKPAFRVDEKRGSLEKNHGDLESNTIHSRPRFVKTERRYSGASVSEFGMCDVDNTIHSTAMDVERLNDVLDIEIYLTQDYEQENAVNHIPGLKTGRPDLAAIFQGLREEAQDLGEKRVAVCVCGPKRVAALCRKACIQLSDKTVRFDFHEEAFG